MPTKKKRQPASERAAYDINMEWSEADLALLRELEEAETRLPSDAPRVLLSVRLSVFTDDTTSPVRQELDLRQHAREKGYRVVGIASDLNVSATKVPPWKRKALGDWLNNRAPEFDVLMFWKMDRFIRNLNDLYMMMNWALRYDKNLVSKNDTIDLTTVAGKIMVTVIGGVAEIEAANTKVRVESLWSYNKTQSEWLVGKPAYGYFTDRDKDGKVVLLVDDEASALLHKARELILSGRSASSIATELTDSTASTLIRRLRNPALLGYRVEEDKQGGLRRSKLLLGHDGQPIRVAPPVFSQEEFDTLQAALDARGKNQPARQPSGATKFLGVLKCVGCETNMIVHHTRNRHGQYAYLRCQGCKSGGLGAPHPKAVYDALVEQVLSYIGDMPVRTREYARGAEKRAEVEALQATVAGYMKDLEPGGRYTKSRFTKEQAEATLDKLIEELDAIDPETTEDRWVYIAGGKTFREHWEEGGMEAMSSDLLRSGVRCDVARSKVPGQRAPQVELTLRIPKDVRERLVVREDAFADQF